MSGHIVHILHHGSRLTKNRGMMVCHEDETEKEHEIAIEDVRAVIIAAHGVFMSPELISALLETNAVILHCDQSYKPVGITSGIERVVKSDALRNQANDTLKLHLGLWKRIVAGKVANQAAVLDRYGKNSAYLWCALENGPADEADCARHYWKEYFSIISMVDILRHGVDEAGLNARLNYGYAVLGALIHRSIIAHGLSPVFGMHHVSRAQAHAMVYDLMEPWRPFVDAALAAFMKESPETNDGMKAWSRHIAGTLSIIKVKTPAQELTVLDAIDVFVSGVAKCYDEKTVRHLWTPKL